jgi:hypothetical protein
MPIRSHGQSPSGVWRTLTTGAGHELPGRVHDGGRVDNALAERQWDAGPRRGAQPLPHPQLVRDRAADDVTDGAVLDDARCRPRPSTSPSASLPRLRASVCAGHLPQRAVSSPPFAPTSANTTKIPTLHLRPRGLGGHTQINRGKEALETATGPPVLPALLDLTQFYGFQTRYCRNPKRSRAQPGPRCRGSDAEYDTRQILAARASGELRTSRYRNQVQAHCVDLECTAAPVW